LAVVAREEIGVGAQDRVGGADVDLEVAVGEYLGYVAHRIEDLDRRPDARFAQLGSGELAGRRVVGAVVGDGHLDVEAIGKAGLPERPLAAGEATLERSPGLALRRGQIEAGQRDARREPARAEVQRFDRTLPVERLGNGLTHADVAGRRAIRPGA